MSNSSYTASGSYIPGPGSYTPGSGSYDSRSHTYGSGSYTPGSNGYTSSAFMPSGSGTYSGTRSYTSSGSYTRSGSYISGGSHSGTDTMTPGISSETGYDVCPSLDLSTLEPGTITEDSLTPSSSLSEVGRTGCLSIVSVASSEQFRTASQGSQASSDYLTAKSRP